MTRKLISYDFASRALVGFGLSRLARSHRNGEGCVLTFHGVREESPQSQVLDQMLHTPLSMFREICRHLAANYRVVPLSDISKASSEHRRMPQGTIALTFDDGYESNYRLAYPVLKEFSLPATVFLTTGFLDGTEKLWFNCLDISMALTKCSSVEVEIGGVDYSFSLVGDMEKSRALEALLTAVKTQPAEEIPGLIARIKCSLGIGSLSYDDYPAPLLPMNWDQAREMRDSGLISFGGHTHRHPILGRCSPERAREEIFLSRDRMIAELGTAPTQFAYTNGKLDDFNEGTKTLLKEAGFEAAYTMLPGFIKAGDDPYALPRYGAPDSVAQAEVTVSGTFETLHLFKVACLKTFAA